jgi:ABC-type transport system involved in multi-copper enzyme maturation permease subunit
VNTLIASAALVRDTFREAFARKLFWGLFGLSTAMILFFLFIMRIDVVEGALATVSLFGQSMGKRTVDVTHLVRQVHASISTFLFSWSMFLALFASAGLIAAVFEPGRIELLLSKPVSRHHILLGRYVGNLLVVGINVSYLVLGIWLIFGWKTGVWNSSFLAVIGTTAFMFGVLLSAMVLVAVLSESGALALMVAFGLMVMSVILAQRTWAERLLSSEWSRNVWRGLYWVFPKVFDIGRMNLDFVQGRAVGALDPIWSSAAFAAVMFAASIYCFSKRNF